MKPISMFRQLIFVAAIILVGLLSYLAGSRGELSATPAQAQNETANRVLSLNVFGAHASSHSL